MARSHTMRYYLEILVPVDNVYTILLEIQINFVSCRSGALCVVSVHLFLPMRVVLAGGLDDVHRIICSSWTLLLLHPIAVGRHWL
jgi:hypothetical protein